jgi:hypothetical protein
MSCNPLAPENAPHWSDSRKIVSISDKPTTKYEGLNPDKKSFSLYRIDADKIVTGQRKCDYLLVRCIDQHCFFIELKGRHLLDAVEQVSLTIDALQNKLAGHILNVRIVLTATNSPDLENIEYRKLDRKVRASGGTIIQRSRLLTETH